MPSNILAADVLFPHLTERQSTDEKFTVVTDYLYMLLEQLRYTLANLGEENFNATELANIGNVITEPVYVMLQGMEGQMASLSLTADGLASRVSDAEGNISTLTQTSDAISQRVSDAEGNISSLAQTASSISFRVTSAEGSISSLTQTVNGMRLSVSNGTQSSTISLVQNGITISSQTVQITGMVTFASLSGSGTSTINGDNIKTGTISAININGCTITGSTLNAVMDTHGYMNGDVRMYYSAVVDYFLAGGIKLELGDAAAGNARARMLVYTNSLIGVPVALKMRAYGGASVESQTANVYIGAATLAEIQAPDIYLWGNVYVNGDKIS